MKFKRLIKNKIKRIISMRWCDCLHLNVNFAISVLSRFFAKTSVVKISNVDENSAFVEIFIFPTKSGNM